MRRYYFLARALWQMIFCRYTFDASFVLRLWRMLFVAISGAILQDAFITRLLVILAIFLVALKGCFMRGIFDGLYSQSEKMRTREFIGLYKRKIFVLLARFQFCCTEKLKKLQKSLITLKFLCKLYKNLCIYFI